MFDAKKSMAHLDMLDKHRNRYEKKFFNGGSEQCVSVTSTGSSAHGSASSSIGAGDGGAHCSGATGSATGGNGSAGIIIITEYA